MEFPPWLRFVAWSSLGLGIACFLYVAARILKGERQQMGIMNIVWPVTCLYSGPIGVWAYLKFGRPRFKHSFAQSSAIGTTHCGAGCTLGDLIAESATALFPVALFGRDIFGTWVVDYILAFLFGIGFQYFAIKPMRKLGPGRALWQALKADTLSLTSWQIGMFGGMAIATFLIFRAPLPKSTAVFWFVMQLAMLLGFVTSYPVNRWLIRRGVKEQM